ncbi:hypothetical protein YC2023_108871 [Brassica napus]
MAIVDIIEMHIKSSKNYSSSILGCKYEEYMVSNRCKEIYHKKYRVASKSSYEDKCEVSKDKHEDRRKMEYFCEAINSTEGRKGKSKPALGGVYKDVEVEEAHQQFFLLSELSALRNF